MESFPILTHEFILVHTPKKKLETDFCITQYIFDNIKQFGNSQALVHSLTDEGLAYDQIIQQSIAVAAALKQKGIKQGDVVAICSENRLEYPCLMLGILAVGATCSPINPIYTTSELQHILYIAKPVMIFCSPFTINKLSEVQAQMPFIKELLLFSDFKDDTYTSYKSLIRNTRNRKAFEVAQINPQEAVAFLFCSSGTTGLPKCVEITHANFMCLINFIQILWKREGSDLSRVTLGLIPFFHGYGVCILFLSLLTKTKIVVMPRFEEENFLHSIEKYKITHLYVVPPIILFLSKHPLVAKYNLSSIRKLTCGAAPLSKETQVTAQKRLKLNFDIQQGYGMTELSVCCVAFQNDVKKVGSSGTIAPGMELKVVDLETGKALPPFGKGELLFRGPFVMKGYKNDPKATAEAFDSDGWFHTGDIGYYDNDGYIYIVSRLKELIKYKGFQVAPAELETVLLTHPDIKEAGVIGIPDEEAGELPLAFVVRQPGSKITEEEVKKFIAEKVSPQKRLHGGVRFINEIPKNPSGKILRRELKAILNKSKL